MSKTSLFSTAKNFIAKHYGDNTGKMLIHTGVIGWVLSSLAQITAIVINDKIPTKQKMFLIPQEAADAGVNIASFYLITQSFQSVAGKLLRTGKWLPAGVRKYLSKQNIADKVGKADFNILKDIELPEKQAKQYKKFADGIDVIATTLGSIISCNIVTPIVRNQYASKRQKTNIARMNGKQQPAKQPIFNKKPSMKDFQSNIYPNFASSSLKI